MVHHQQRVLPLRKAKPKDRFDYVVYFFMVATPLFELTQAYTIYSSKSAENVSVLTWGFFFMSSIVMLTYSIKKKLMPLIVMYSMYMVVEASVLIGIIIYSYL